MPHWRVVGQDAETALQDLSGGLGRLETSDRDDLEVQWRTSDFAAASPAPGSPSPRWPPRSASTPRRSSAGSSSDAFPTAPTVGRPRHCWGPTRPICGPNSPTSDAHRQPAPPSWSPSPQPRRRPRIAVAQPPGGRQRPHRRARLCRPVPARRLSRDRQAACRQGQPRHQGAPCPRRSGLRCGASAGRGGTDRRWPRRPGPARPDVPTGGDRGTWGRASLPRHHAVQLALPVR